MKKFSNIDEKNLVLSEQKPKFNKLISHLIRENLQVTYHGDVDEAITKNLTVDGSDELVEKLVLLIKEHKETTELSVMENLKYKHIQFDQNRINNEIKENISNIYLNITPFPHDIFSNEDYEFNGDAIILNSLNNMPSDYMDHVNHIEASKYFESGNNIKMRYNSGTWELYFETNGKKYGTPIDSVADKYKKFITENKEFVGDFLRATQELVGAQNIQLDKYLISQI